MTQGTNPQHTSAPGSAAPGATPAAGTVTPGGEAAPAGSTQPTPPAPPPPDTVSLTIDGKRVTAKKGTLLVEAAKQVGIEIPVFCYHPKLKSVGACRMCLVQIEKMPRLQTACTTPVAPDMVVNTRSAEVIGAQNGVIELLLANHPLDCPICDKGGECPLQDNTFRFGLGVSRFTEEKRHKEKAYPLGERIVLDRERCIMCYRCVRFHQEIAGDEALAAIQRGASTEISAPAGESYDSIFSGNTIELCPVGALTSRQYRFKARPWDLVRTPSVCNGCAVGCNIEIHSRTETVLRLVSRENPAVDDGWLCDVGRFDTLPAGRGARPARPLLRETPGSALREASWSEALERTAAMLRQQGQLLASTGLSNEALWLLESLAPVVRAAVWPPSGHAWPVQGAIANLAGCKAIVLVGLDVWHELPILALWIHKAVQNGGTLVCLGPSNGLWRSTAHWLRGEPGELVGVFADAVAGGVTRDAPPELLAAAAAVRGVGPVALLAHPRLAETHRAALDELARTLSADSAQGLIGAPLLAANGRGAQLFAPSLVAADARGASASSVLLIGDEPWAELDTGTARLAVVTSRPVPDDPRVDVVLPMAHPYERQASITNLEGRVQLQEGGAAPPFHARSDWGIVAALAECLGQGAPADLRAIRAAIAQAQPELAAALITEEPLVARV